MHDREKNPDKFPLYTENLVLESLLARIQQDHAGSPMAIHEGESGQQLAYVLYSLQIRIQGKPTEIVDKVDVYEISSGFVKPTALTNWTVGREATDDQKGISVSLQESKLLIDEMSNGLQDPKARTIYKSQLATLIAIKDFQMSRRNKAA